MPMTYTAGEREAAIRRAVDGLRKGTPLTVICSEAGMPCDDTIRDWAQQDETVGRDIARARDAGFDILAMEAQAIQDEPPATMMTEYGSRIDPAGVAHQKNRFEAKLKLLSKWDPKRYGELIKHAGADGGPMTLVVSSEDAGA
jgi:hypothetical protein